MTTYKLTTRRPAPVPVLPATNAALTSLRRMGIEYAITLWPEWTWPIAHLDKRCENRGWKLPDSMLGKRIAIHAGAAIGGRKGLPARREGIRSMLDTARGAGWALTVETGALKLTKGSALIIAPLPMHSALREDLPIVTSAVRRRAGLLASPMIDPGDIIERLQIEHDRRLIAAAEVWVLVLLFVWVATMLP